MSDQRANAPTMAALLSEHGIGRAYALAPGQAWSALTRGLLDYWTTALARGETPLDVVIDAGRWVSAATTHDQPTWTTPHRVVAEWPIARLRDFTPRGTRATGVATLLLPPQAGHSSCIVDFDEGQSQVATAMDAGLARIASLDWISASHATRNATIEDYLQVVDRAVDELGGPVNLIGDCQGGWLAAIYAALHPDRVHTLTVAGAPIDSRAGTPQLQQWLGLFAPFQRLEWYAQEVARNDGRWPGHHQIAGFKAMEPAGEFSRMAGLLGQLHDPQAMARYKKFTDWFESGQDLPGPFYLWTLEHLFVKNELATGDLRIGRDRVDLSRIRCPLHLIAGRSDHITPAEQVWALEGLVGTDAGSISRDLVPAGHLGLFMGREALEQHWSPILTQIAAQSTP